MELREPELQRTVEYSICGNIMEANIVSQDTSHTSPLSGTLTIPSIPSSSPPPLSSHPPARPCRPKQPPSTAKASHVPSRPPLPTSAPLSLPPPVSKPPPPIPIKADPPFVPTPLSSNPPPLALVPPLSPTMASTCPLSSPQPNVSYDLSSTFTHAALPLLLSATTSLASSSSPSPPPLPVMPPFSPTAPLPSPIDRLLSTTSVWQPKGLSQSQITAILEKEAAGVFVVHSTEDNDMILSVRVSDEHEAPHVHSVMFKQLKTYVHLDGSCMVFDDIFKLISFYCVSRDILAVRLMLPWAITTATRREDLEAISAMGADFWTSYLNQKVKKQDQDLVQQHNGLYWYVNPVPVEKCPEIDPNTTATCIHDITHQNITSSPQIGPEAKGQIQIKTNKEIKYKRPPPRPPSLGCGMGLLFSAPSLSQSSSSITTAAERKEEGKGGGGEKEGRKLTLISPPPLRPSVLLQSRATPPLPPAPLHGTACKKSTYQEVGEGTGREKGQNPAEKIEKEGGGEKGEEVVDQENSNQQQEEEEEKGKKKEVEKEEKKEDKQIYQSQCRSLSTKPSRPVPPPRKKRPPLCPSETEGGSANQTAGKRPSPPSQMPRPDVSLYSPQGGAALGPDPDSCSTSSTEEEAEPLQEQEQNHNCPTGSHSPKAAMKRTSTTIMLDRARYRLSTVLTGLISHDRRLTQRVIEMARAPTSYIGNLVKEHRAFTLETMSKHLTSTELLQEIRQMMTQLKSYLLQSAELQALLEPQHQYSQDKIENIVEAALCKSVLKPLREPIYHSLEKLHTANGSLKQLTQNQSIVLGSTTTALGITTAVPEASAMEKISIKLNNLHLEYSPQKKIELLLKSCKIIYDAMSVSCPGRTHGADDFLPVMMYVLARSNLSALQLDVEYMMELMDPSLTLGEGSYYLTTTYGALEHIKTFDQQRSATRQLSREVQDSIHRWERRRTLNKDSTSQGSIRDFLTVCCPEIDANPKTLGVLPTTTIQQLSEQCTARFEQGEDSYTLSVYIDGVHQPLALTELALSVKNSCQPGTYCFVYHPIGQPSNKPSRTCPSDPPPAPPAESLSTASTQPVNTVETEAAEEILIEL